MENFTPGIQNNTVIQRRDTLNAVKNNNSTGRFGYLNKAKVYVGGASVDKTWDTRSDKRSDKRSDTRSDKRNPVLSSNECMKIGIHGDPFVSEKKVSQKKAEVDKDGISVINKITHREKVLSEIKLFFQFKQQEGYITKLKRDIEDIKLQCFIDLEDVKLKFSNLEFELWNTNNLLHSVSHISENLCENKRPVELMDTQNYLDQGEKSNDGNIFVGSEYRQGSRDNQSKIERDGIVENIDFNQLVPPAYKVSLNGSKIFLPPVKMVHETTNELGQCLENLSQIREFIRNVSAESN